MVLKKIKLLFVLFVKMKFVHLKIRKGPRNDTTWSFLTTIGSKKYLTYDPPTCK